jgi:hypothetical protein
MGLGFFFFVRDETKRLLIIGEIRVSGEDYRGCGGV